MKTGTLLFIFFIQAVFAAFSPISVLRAENLSLTITEPVPGGSYPAGPITVRGTFSSDTPDVGIVVNGKPAAILGNLFVAQDISLRAGSNILTLHARTWDGTMSSASLGVRATEPERDDYLRLDSNYLCGTPPLEVAFSLDGEYGDQTAYALDADGDGAFDGTITERKHLDFTYTRPGVYIATAVPDKGTGTYDSLERIVVVEDPNFLAPVLTGRWDDLNLSLAKGDIRRAVDFFIPASRSKYAGLYLALREKLPDMAHSASPPAFVHMENGRAKLRVRREEEWKGKMETITYYIYLVRDFDGIWRIDEF